MAWGALIPFIPDAINAGKQLVGGSSGPCAGQLTAAQVDAIRRNAPDYLIRPTADHWNSVASRPRFTSAPAGDIARWLAGGDDCKHEDPYGAQLSDHWKRTLAPAYGGSSTSSAPAGPAPSPTYPAEAVPSPVPPDASNSLSWGAECRIVNGKLDCSAQAGSPPNPVEQLSATILGIPVWLWVLGLIGYVLAARGGGR